MVQGSRVPGHAFCLAILLFMFVSLACFYDFLLRRCWEHLAGDTPNFGSARGRSSRRLGSVGFSLFWFSRITELADFIFPRLWLHQKCPEVFWFHPAELGRRVFFMLCVSSSLVGFLIAASNVIPSLIDLVYC